MRIANSSMVSTTWWELPSSAGICFLSSLLYMCLPAFAMWSSCAAASEIASRSEDTDRILMYMWSWMTLKREWYSSPFRYACERLVRRGTTTTYLGGRTKISMPTKANTVTGRALTYEIGRNVMTCRVPGSSSHIHRVRDWSYCTTNLTLKAAGNHHFTPVSPALVQ